MRPFILLAALIGAIGAAGQAHAESCNDLIERARDIRSQFESGASTQQAALTELRNLRLLANGCDASPQNPIDAIIQRVSSAAPPPAYSPPEDADSPPAEGEHPQTWSPPEDVDSPPEN